MQAVDIKSRQQFQEKNIGRIWVKIRNRFVGVAPITQYAYMRNKNSNTQGIREVPILRKGRNCRESLLDTVVSL